MKTKTICMFCAKSKCKTELCDAKAQVIKAYCKAGVKVWQVMHGVETGQLQLDKEAKAYLYDVNQAQKKAKKKKKKGKKTRKNT